MMRDLLLLGAAYVALAWVPGVGWRWMLALAGAPVAVVLTFVLMLDVADVDVPRAVGAGLYHVVCVWPAR